MCQEYVIYNYYMNFIITYVKDQNYEASYSFLGNLGRKKNGFSIYMMIRWARKPNTMWCSSLIPLGLGFQRHVPFAGLGFKA